MASQFSGVDAQIGRLLPHNLLEVHGGVPLPGAGCRDNEWNEADVARQLPLIFLEFGFASLLEDEGRVVERVSATVLTQRRNDGDVEGNFFLPWSKWPRTLDGDVPRAGSVVEKVTFLLPRLKEGRLGTLEDVGDNFVVSTSSATRNDAGGDGVIAENVRIFSAERALSGGREDWQAQPVLKGKSKFPWRNS